MRLLLCDDVVVDRIGTGNVIRYGVVLRESLRTWQSIEAERDIVGVRARDGGT
jgi:hypothetical protein